MISQGNEVIDIVYNRRVKLAYLGCFSYANSKDNKAVRMGRYRAGVGVLLQTSVVLFCLTLAWSCVRALNGLSDEEWEAGLGTDMCPEKKFDGLENLDVAVRKEQALPEKDSELTDMKQLLGQQSAQIKELGDLITRLSNALQKLPAPSLLPLPQTTPSTERLHRLDDYDRVVSSVGQEEQGKPIPISIPSIPSDDQKPSDTSILDNQLDDDNLLPHTASTEGLKSGGEENLEEEAFVAAAPNLDKVKVGGYGLGGGMTVARYKPAWAEHFQFVSAVKVDVDVTCLHVLPHEGDDGMSRYVAVGDAAGRIYIFFIHGDLLVDYTTLSRAPVTAMLSFTLRKNETWLVSGHADGAVLVHRVSEIVQRGAPSSGDDAHNLVMDFVHALVMPVDSQQQTGGEYNLGGLFETEAKGTTTLLSDDAPPSKLITHLEMYRVGKMRYVLVTDSAGKMQVFRENGTLYGVAESPSRPLAFLRTPNTQRLLFLTKSGAGSLDLRSMTVRSCPCDGLNSSTVVAYTFDAAGRSRAYGFTSEGDLVYVALSGDTLHFECHARTTKRKLDVEGPVSPHGLKGYLVVATPKQVFVYNTTLQVGFSYANIRGGGGPRPLFSASMEDIALSFLPTPITPGEWPTMACNRDKLVVLGFGGGYVGIYRSNLPVYKLPDFNAKLWSSPIFISVLLLLGAWQLLSRKREPALSADNPVMQIGGSSASGGASGFRKYEENVRPGFRENREGSLGESRRYESPSRAYGNKPASYNPGSISSYWASSAEPNSYSTRREREPGSLFANQNVGDLRH